MATPLKVEAKRLGITVSELKNRRKQEKFKAHKPDLDIEGTMATVFLRRKMRSGQYEAQLIQAIIPDKASIDRDDAILAMNRSWKHNTGIGATVLEYLASSSSLIAARAGMNIKVHMGGNMHVHKFDMDNLGCIIDFEVESNGDMYTSGPKWQSGDSVMKIGKAYLADYDGDVQDHMV